VSDYFNDSPIEKLEDDRYDFGPFAHSIAKSFRDIKNPVGTTIALNGAWGSGKSSAINLIRRELEATNDDVLVITEFKCWWYRGDEALALAFLQSLHTVIKKNVGDKVKDLIPNIGRPLLQAGKVLGPAISLATSNPLLGALAAGSTNFAKTFFPDGQTPEEAFHKLSEILEKQNQRFLVILDDIDRLNPEEALAVFRLVKSVGRLPNVMYLLVFDRQLADAAVLEYFPSEGPHFLEKIIQASFEIPVPLQTDLNNAILSSVEDICGTPSEEHIQRFMNLFYDGVAPYITTPRHVVRFQNTISVTWPAVADEVNCADFVALEILRLYEPSVFQQIRFRKNQICGGFKQQDSDQRNETRFDPYLQDVPEERHSHIKLILQRLFPRLEAVSYSGEIYSGWDIERRVCIEKHFDTYFRLSLSDETLSKARISELIERAGDSDFIRKTFLEAVQFERKNGKSMVPVYLDELTLHATQVQRDKVKVLLKTLFEIHDDIDLQKDNEDGFMNFGGTTLRLHWLIRRLTENRFTIDERSDLYLEVTEHAALGWLVSFVEYAKKDYSEGEDGPKRQEDCLTTKDSIESLTERAVTAIRAVADNGSLLYHQAITYILHHWSRFAGNDPTEARAWTDSLMDNDEALVIFARKFTGKSWGMGGGSSSGLDDRVSIPSVMVQIRDDIDYLDINAFKIGLERIRDEAKLETESLAIVATFLDAWDRKQGGNEW
jgi:predicted KAP-like P-loop ATPase